MPKYNGDTPMTAVAFPVRRALLSVSDKTDLVPFARFLHGRGVELLSTGGTRRALADAGLPAREVADLTGFPEVFGGRVKTLHPLVHGGLLFRRDDPADAAEAERHGVPPIDLLVVNLYPFERVAADPAAAEADLIDNIDVGGPAMVRAAAKNAAHVVVVTDPSQYTEVQAALEDGDPIALAALRKRLQAAAFALTARYDRAIADTLAGRLSETAADGEGEFPPRLTLTFERLQPLRYGENPHQRAALYGTPGGGAGTVVRAERLHGKELSYNNLLDLDSVWALVADLPGPACAVVKHNNPCGAAAAATAEEAFRLAYAGDPVSAFGGVVGFNVAIDEAAARALAEPGRFVEAVVAPSFSPAALEVLTTVPTWKNSVRLLAAGDPHRPPTPGTVYRPLAGGLLAQSADAGADDISSATCVTRRGPTAAEREALQFAWRVCKHVRSNAIVLGRGTAVVGVGAGQMSRIDAVNIAAAKAGDRAAGSVLASDAFFPFRDNVDRAAAAGVTAVVQPGGSKRDADSVAACDEHGIAMLFTGVRHFRH